MLRMRLRLGMNTDHTPEETGQEAAVVPRQLSALVPGALQREALPRRTGTPVSKKRRAKSPPFACLRAVTLERGVAHCSRSPPNAPKLDVWPLLACIVNGDNLLLNKCNCQFAPENMEGSDGSCEGHEGRD